MAIYFVRHGKDEDGYLGGWSQRGLIKEGIQQSITLGFYLRDHMDMKINRIISSDLRRAAETSKYIGDILQVPIEQSESWRETNNGIFAGMPIDEANKNYPGLYFSNLKMDERYPGGESPIENFMRIKLSFEGLCKEQLEKNDQENVLVVTHGGVINIVYHLVKEMEWTNKNKKFPADYTSMHKLERVMDRWEFAAENFVGHLHEHNTSLISSETLRA